LRDERARGWFHLDNAVIDEYLPKIGVTAFAVYACIVRHADPNGNAFPSYTKLQAELGTGRHQVAAAIKKIVDVGLVTITPGKRSQNVYHIATVATSAAEELVPIRNQSRISTSSAEEPELVPQRNSWREIPPTPPYKEELIKRTRPNKQDTVSASAPSPYPADFETFWSAYGRKGTKSTAANEWKRHAKGIPLAVILDAIPVYFATERVAVRGFKLDAERFLSRHVWENPTMGEENDAPARASPNGNVHRPVTFAEQKLRNTLDAHAEFERITDEQESLQRTDGPVGDRLRGGSEHRALARVLGPGEKSQR
jgi:hypothetical protein